MPTWKINLKEQTTTSVKERYHLQADWNEAGGVDRGVLEEMMAGRKLINGVNKEMFWKVLL